MIKTKDPKIIQERMDKYREWRTLHDFPQFEPEDGKCWNCKKQIFELVDGTQSITGCPHCHRSFVD